MSLSIDISDDLVEALAERVAERLQGRRRWFTTEGLADHLGVSPRFVRGLRERGLAGKRVGKRLLYDIDEVDEFLEKQ